MMSKMSVYQWINILAIAFIAFFSAQFMHEMTHYLSATALGLDVHAFHYFAVHIGYHDVSITRWQILIVEASASIINVLIALISFGLFYKVKHAYMKLMLML